MSSVNKVILIGNVGKDPEVRFTGAGQAVANFTIATNEIWTDKTGAKQERVEWHRITTWGKLAELCGQYLQKGRSAYVEGRITTREWEDKEGKKQFTTEIVASEVKFLGAKGDDAAPPHDATTGEVKPPAARSSGSPPTVFPNFGRAKGAAIAGASADDLAYYEGKAKESLADSAKSRWHDKERSLLEAIQAEHARQGGGASTTSGGSGRGAPSDDDVPFVAMETGADRC